TYAYGEVPQWHHDDDHVLPAGRQSWTDWRGHSTVTVTTGTAPEARTVTRYRFLRGMHGDRLVGGGTRSVQIVSFDGSVSINDDNWLAGRERDQSRVNTAGTEVTGQLTGYYVVGTAGGGAGAARFVSPNVTMNRVRVFPAGTVRRTQVRTGYALPTLQPNQVIEDGDVSIAGDERCTTVEYATNVGAHMLTYVSREVRRHGAGCAGVASDHRNFYDGHPNYNDPVTVGNPTRTLDWTGTPDVWVETHATFDGYGRPTSATDANGHTSTTSYAPATGLPTQVTVTNPSGHVTTTALNRERGQPTAVTDANGHATTYQYDLLGRVTRVWRPTEPTAGPASWEFAYSIPRTAPTVVQTRQLQSGGDNPVYLNAFTLYDGQLRVRETQTPSPAGGRVVTGTRYNTRGLGDRVSLPFHSGGTPGAGLVNPATFAAENLTKYDEQERPAIEIFLVQGTERWRTTTTFSGDRITVAPPGGRSPTVTHLDAYDRVRSVDEGLEASRTSYSYDVNTDLLLGVTDPAGNQTSITYDALGRKTSMTDPDLGVWSYTYDPAGNLLTQTDARGQTVWFGYDHLHRPTHQRRNGPTGQVLARWTYDAAGALGLPASSTSYDADRLAYVERVTGYDARNRVTEREWSIPAGVGPTAGTYRMAFGYDAADHPTTTRFPANNTGGLGETVTTDYDGFGQPFSLVGTTAYVASSAYTALGQPQSHAIGPITRSFDYEPDTQRLHRRSATTATGTLQDLTYSWLATGEVNTIVDAAAANQRLCHRYDPRGRLAEAFTGNDDCTAYNRNRGPDPYHQTFTYDPIGNITQTTSRIGDGGQTNRNYTYDPGHPHAATRAGPDTFTYDPAGNMATRTVAGDTQTLTWDHANRLTAVTAPGPDSSYAYTAAGERIRRTDGTTTTITLGGSYELHATGAGAVTATKHYLFAGARVATRVGTALHYTLGDHLGSTAVTHKADGSDTRTQRYYPYGSPRPGPGHTLPTDRTYTGQTADNTTGLMYYGARYYDPTLARFTSPDTITPGIGSIALNRYAYANNNPAFYTDPTGHDVDGSPREARREGRLIGRNAVVMQVIMGPNWDVGSRPTSACIGLCGSEHRASGANQDLLDSEDQGLDRHVRQAVCCGRPALRSRTSRSSWRAASGRAPLRRRTTGEGEGGEIDDAVLLDEVQRAGRTLRVSNTPSPTMRPWSNGEILASDAATIDPFSHTTAFIGSTSAWASATARRTPRRAAVGP
ncbi:MAG: RHS repeat domain-containing protein, partial [Acidimicrobiales bacterium]